MASCPHLKFLAAGPAARAHGGNGGGGSRLGILRLWRKPEEPEHGRQLEVIATIPAPGDGAFHRLAWSARDANSAYPLGLLAGALDDGVVCVWDPSLLPYEHNVSQGGDDGASFFTLSAFTSEFFGEPSTRSYQSDSSLVLKKFPMEKFKKVVEEAASNMLLGFDDLIKDKFTAKDHKESNPSAEDNNVDSEGWELVPGRGEVDLEDWEVLPNKTDYVDHGSTDGLLLKLHDMTGQVLGLSFNNPCGNVLACGGLSEKLVFYHLDCSIKTCKIVDTGSKEINRQITFLDWHPVYPVVLASANDAGIAKIWDLREKKSTCRFKQENKGYCTETRWNPNHPLQIAVSSTGTQTAPPVEIWDARKLLSPLLQFGPEKGVASLSWCADPNLIITTSADGAVDGWKLNEIEGPDPSWNLYNLPDHIPLHSFGREETLWCQNENVIAVSSSTDIGLYKLKPLSTVHFS